MDHSSLITSLSADLSPVPPRSLHRDLTAAVVLGGSATLAVVVTAFGIQPGLDTLAGGGPLLMKVAYAGTIAAGALGAAYRLARPGGGPAMHRAFALIGFAALGVVAAGQLLGTTSDVTRAFLGASWQACSLRIAVLSLPLLAGMMLLLRRYAPVRLRDAGAAAGMASGGIAASLYALACTESAAPFVLVWYTLGIALATLLGGLLGPKILRW